MRTWCKILPFFIVEYLAKKHMSVYQIRMGTGDSYYRVVNPFTGVYIEVSKEKL